MGNWCSSDDPDCTRNEVLRLVAQHQLQREREERRSLPQRTPNPYGPPPPSALAAQVSKEDQVAEVKRIMDRHGLEGAFKSFTRKWYTNESVDFQYYLDNAPSSEETKKALRGALRDLDGSETMNEAVKNAAKRAILDYVSERESPRKPSGPGVDVRPIRGGFDEMDAAPLRAFLMQT